MEDVRKDYCRICGVDTEMHKVLGGWQCMDCGEVYTEDQLQGKEENTPLGIIKAEFEKITDLG